MFCDKTFEHIEGSLINAKSVLWRYQEEEGVKLEQ
jgi:hypothetical protein